MKVKRNLIQQGYILVIALVLILVMAFSALSTARLAGVDNLVNSNTRSRVQALQAAESALAYCRSQLRLDGGSAVNIIADDGNEGLAWKDASTWGDDSKINVVTPDKVFNALQTSTLKTGVTSPVCVIENVTTFTQNNSSLDQTVVAYKITVRGYSPNYTVDSSGTQVSGAQAWLQVVVARMIS